MNLDILPLWLKGGALILSMTVAVEAGYRMDGWVARLNIKATPGRLRGDWGVLVGGALSLLALLLAFTVNMANARYQTRRELGVAEANAISTVYLRAQLLNEPARTNMSLLTDRYARDRRAIFLAGDARAQIARAQSASDADEDGLWRATALAVHDPANASLNTSLLSAMNTMFDVAATRHEALQARVPPRILLVLLLDSLLTAALIGYGLASGNDRRLVGSFLLCLMVTLTMMLILDLDHPASGGIKILEGPLDRVVATIDRAEAAKTAAR